MISKWVIIAVGAIVGTAMLTAFCFWLARRSARELWLIESDAVRHQIQLQLRGAFWRRSAIWELYVPLLIGTSALVMIRWYSADPAIGLLSAIALFGLFPFFLRRFLRRDIRKAMIAMMLCPVCGYDLTGNESGVCPECGTEVENCVR